MVVLYAKGCMEVKRMELRLWPKECIKHDKQSFPFDEHLAMGERESSFTNKHNYGMFPNNLFSQSNPNIMQNFQMPSNMLNQLLRYLYCLHMDDDQCNHNAYLC